MARAEQGGEGKFQNDQEAEVSQTPQAGLAGNWLPVTGPSFPAPSKDLSPTPGLGVATARGLDPDPASSRPWTKKHGSQRPGRAAPPFLLPFNDFVSKKSHLLTREGACQCNKDEALAATRALQMS